MSPRNIRIIEGLLTVNWFAILAYEVTFIMNHSNTQPRVSILNIYNLYNNDNFRHTRECV